MNKNDQMMVAVEHIKRVCPDRMGQGIMAAFAQNAILHSDTQEKQDDPLQIKKNHPRQ